MKPLQYYIPYKIDQLDRLTERFGNQLELLDRTQKLQLRAILSLFLLGRDTMSYTYSVQDAVADLNLWQLFIPDEDLALALLMLEGIDNDQAEILLEALQAQCRHGNARLKTSTESMADELERLDIPTELAQEAAYILTVVDVSGQRTDHQQLLIARVHKLILSKKMNSDERGNGR